MAALIADYKFVNDWQTSSNDLCDLAKQLTTWILDLVLAEPYSKAIVWSLESRVYRAQPTRAMVLGSRFPDCHKVTMSEAHRRFNPSDWQPTNPLKP